RLPESLGELWNLEALDVSNNSLSGTILTSLSDTSRAKLVFFSYALHVHYGRAAHQASPTGFGEEEAEG
ncbi:hypothetical protein RJ640_001934, partial [Escallonia rubra]